MKIKTEALILFSFLIIIGFTLAPDFGISWDEYDNAVYGQQALRTYLTLDPPEEWHSNLESKGPFFIAITEAFSKTISTLLPNWGQYAGRHLAYYLSFILAVFSFYGLAGKLAGRNGALTATILFATQPLLFGHAFINPKDIPFMAFFLLTMWVGVLSIEKLSGNQKNSWLKLGLILVAGIILGLTVSIRIFGAFAGLLITLWGLIQLGKRCISYMVGFWSIAALTMFASWPYLWSSPVTHLAESLKVMLDFPWDNLVLYRGLLYPVVELPWHFLPFITVIQLTETLLILGVIGGLWGIYLLVGRRRHRDSRLYFLLILWIVIPYSYSMASGSTVYDNSRQFLFALPPIALVTAPIIDAIFRHIKQKWALIIVLAAILMPGLLGIVQLHPYEYIYFNSIVGGVKGAFRTYELDYWATSYREAMELTNDIAPTGAVVEVQGPWQAAAQFSRLDITVIKSGAEIPPDLGSSRYFIVSTRLNADQTSFTDATIVASVEIENATLAVVKSIE
jgi:4-amino-4-deoxy-L-arabinose transferase-like glycosyltransferase